MSLRPLALLPPVVAVTFTEKVQELLAGKVAPLRIIEVAFGTAVIVPPPQLPLSPFGEETLSPDGNGSVK